MTCKICGRKLTWESPYGICEYHIWDNWQRLMEEIKKRGEKKGYYSEHVPKEEIKP